MALTTFEGGCCISGVTLDHIRCGKGENMIKI